MAPPSMFVVSLNPRIACLDGRTRIISEQPTSRRRFAARQPGTAPTEVAVATPSECSVAAIAWRALPVTSLAGQRLCLPSAQARQAADPSLAVSHSAV